MVTKLFKEFIDNYPEDEPIFFEDCSKFFSDNKKNVNNKVLIWAPSTSASAIRIILSYLNFVISNSLPIPAPNAVITGWSLSLL